jgi:hypothetical protein
LTYCDVLAAKGVKEALKKPCQHVLELRRPVESSIGMRSGAAGVREVLAESLKFVHG